jgi:predicted enzyme related to lactoylglutathione lyase
MKTLIRRRTLLAAALASAGTAALAQAVPWPPVGEPVAGARVAGRWLWFDLRTPDPAAAAAFYARTLGWSIAPHAGAGGGYDLVRARGRAIGGIVRGAGARWVPLASGDPALMAERAQQRGGAVVTPARTVAGRGDLALLADPDGTAFGVLRAAGGDPADLLGGMDEWLWLELWTRMPGRAANFFRDVFGYAVDAAGATDAYLLVAGGRARAGVMQSPDAALPPAWVPYVRVADVAAVAARAQAGGARVIVPARAHHRSQVAVLVDPQGAPFALADWRPQ